jgi:hypothetical protein
MEKENVKIEETPGVRHPGNLNFEDQDGWYEEYNKLSSEKKILLETQEQTRLIQRISKNVLFWFWLTIIGLIGYVIIIFDVLK